MKKRNFVMQTAIASALLTSVGAYAAVNLDATPVVPALYAKEIIATVAAPVTLLNTANVLDLTVATGYSMNATEVRYVRMELDNGAKFAAGATVTVAPNGGGTCTAGAVNGLGTSVIYFSLTAAGTGCNALSTITVAGNQTITNTNTTSAAYSMYDQPSQAQAGGSSGRIVNKAFASYVTFGPSFSFVGANGTTVTAGVEATPVAFGKFLNAATPPAPTLLTAVLGTLNYRLVAAPVPLKADGTAIALTDLMATGGSGTKLVVTGDFSGGLNAATPPVLDVTKVFLAPDATCASAVASTTLTATTATFNVGATATTANPQLCYTVTGNVAIPVQSYTAALNPVSAAPTVYSVAAITGQSAGNIVRNGTELQTPLFQTQGGYLSRLVLTNTSSTPALFTVIAKGEAGNVLTAGAVTSGSVPANGMLVLNSSDIVASFSGAARGYAVFSVSAPNNVIQGVYQITNISSGAVSNTIMVRPGTN